MKLAYGTIDLCGVARFTVTSSKNLVESLSTLSHRQGCSAHGAPPGRWIRIAKPPPKSNRGGKYTSEGSADLAQNELEAVPPDLKKNDPNCVDEERDENDVGDLVVREIEVAKAAEEEDGKGVGRLDVVLPA
ncbi:hypothetical protein K1719_010039 [Acacia pycnantha]|nr:hypothetical protein K1719_010039 [Acacia pycnantha]